MNKLLFNLFILPTSLLWAKIYSFRRFLYEYGIFRREYYKAPIISVGNLSFGGTGKTPFILWLISEIENLDKKSMILTRGYKGKLENSKGIISSHDANNKDPSVYGDEPFLIARRSNNTSVVVGKKRSKNLEHYFSDVLPDIVLLDDGFQHLKLFRNFNIVLFDSLLELDSYHCAPRGYLREDLSALRFADCVLFSRANKVSREKLESLEQLVNPYLRDRCIIGSFDYKCSGVFNFEYQKVHELDYLSQKKIIFLSAIANPESFYRIVDNYNVDIIEKIEYADHHNYSEIEITEIINKAKDQNALVITTEKDFVKINKVAPNENIYYLSISIDFIKGRDELTHQVRKLLSIA